MKLFKWAFFILLVLTCLGYSQHTDKGVYILSGQASYTTTSVENDDDNYNYIAIDPLFAYFVADNIAIGGTLLYYNQSYGNNSMSGFGIGPAIAYYFNAGNISPFIMGSFVYSSVSIDGVDDSSSETNIIIGLGTDFFLSKNVSIQPMISYDMYSGSRGDIDFSDQKTFKLGVGIGVYIY